MLELEEALARILAAVPAPSGEKVSLREASGRVLAEEVRSPVDLPMFDNSAMDGYGLRAGDVASAKPDLPVRLRLAGKAAPGQPFAGEVTAGTCVRVSTGSPLPSGADAVVMQEETHIEASTADEVLILAPVEPGENVRSRGEDVRRGSTLAEAGEFVTFGRISLLAAAGLTSLRVGRRPVVGMLATGSELREPGQALGRGQIYEGTRLGLAALIDRAGAVARMFPIVPDEFAATCVALMEAFEDCDAVVTCGGVSVGEMDFVKRAFTEIGGEMQFWKVAIKPGRPVAFGRCRGKLLFGLPGNPVSALVTFLLLVRPALLRWQGATSTSLPSHPGVLAEPLVNRGDRRHFMRVRVDTAGRIVSAGAQASHILSALAGANGLVDVPANVKLEEGSTVTVRRWE